jgi:hypothetical protein
MWFLALFPIMLFIAIGIRLAAGYLDRDRIRSYVEARGGRFRSATWAPFGPGWFGGAKERIYFVRYFDFEGNEHEAYVRTSMWAGVYFTEDQVVHYVKPPLDVEEVESLEEENARLRAEVERLKRRERERGSDAIQE